MKTLLPLFLTFLLLASCKQHTQPSQTTDSIEVIEYIADSTVPQSAYSKGADQFVVLTDIIPDALLEIRYYCTFNFIGDRIPGYEEPVALLTHRAADSLRAVSDELRQQGYILKIYDAYRPQCAVDYFMKWAKDLSDTRMKDYFYPEIEKAQILPQGYVASHSGHTRGSTVDLTLFDLKTQRDVDMGCTFDYFGKASHPGLQPGENAGGYPAINKTQYDNRMILRKAMMRHGFRPYENEWWHFTLRNEPFPKTYFNFPVSLSSVPRMQQQ